jgi:hypothetical protein
MPLAGRLLLLGLLGAIAAAVLGAEHIGHLTALADRLADISAQIRIRLTVLLAAGIALGARVLDSKPSSAHSLRAYSCECWTRARTGRSPLLIKLEAISFGLLIPVFPGGAERSPTFRMPVSVRPPR